MKFITGAASVISTIFSPLLMATYGVALAMFLSFLCFIPAATKLTVILETFLATAAIPVIGIFILSRFKVISDPKLNERRDRTFPYIIETACFIGLAVYLNHINAPAWLSLFLIGGAVALIVLTVVNRWWKISGHATGMGGALCPAFLPDAQRQQHIQPALGIPRCDSAGRGSLLGAGGDGPSYPRPGGCRIPQRLPVGGHSADDIPGHTPVRLKTKPYNKNNHT